jgi:cell division protein FtsQ
VRTAAATLRLLPRAALALPPQVRRALAAALAAVAVLLLGYFLWLRDSPLVAVDHVQISGLTTKDAHRIKAALIASAEDMTTLHVRRDRLALAVSGYPVVASVRATPDFPHGLRIRVVEHRPVALLLIRGAASVAVAADGTVLRGLPADRSLAVVRTQSPPRGARLTRGHGARAIRSVAAAPAPLRRRIERVDEKPGRGLVVQLRRGPELILGRMARLEAKWAAAARVLADPAARGASYVDVSLPERPVAGGLGAQTIAPAATAGARPEPDHGQEPGATTTPEAQPPAATNPQP